MSLKAIGLKEVIRKFRRYPRNIDIALGALIRKTAFEIEAEAKRQVTTGPNRALDTGRMRASIRVNELSATRAVIQPNVNYATFVHEGTRYMQPPRPFMVDAGNQVRKGLGKKAGIVIRRAYK